MYLGNWHKIYHLDLILVVNNVFKQKHTYLNIISNINYRLLLFDVDACLCAFKDL